MSLVNPVIAAMQSSQQPTPVVKPEIVRQLNHFMAANKIIRFKYDSSQVANGSTITIFPKRTVGTREIFGEISKDQLGNAIVRVTIDEKDGTLQQKFENDIAGAFIGLHVVGTRQIIASGKQVAKLPAGHWGALIVEELPNSGTYEITLSATPITPKP